MRAGDKAGTTVLWQCIIKASLLLCFGLVFSLSVYAEFVGSAIACDDYYNDSKEYLKKHPDNVSMIFHTGFEALCTGKERDGMRYMEKASAMGHVMASLIIGRYYQTDGTLDWNHHLTTDPNNFNAAIYYYEKAATQIEENSSYPEGASDDIPYLEGVGYASAMLFDFLPNFYYIEYSRAIKDILSANSEYSDLTEILVKMRNSSERCLQRPALAVWKSERYAIWIFLQVRCGVKKDFAEEVLILEQKRAAIAGRCDSSLNECSEHKEIVDQIKEKARLMWDTIGLLKQHRY